MPKSVDQLCINTLRFLAVDAVQKAQSGHPGMPMGAAPMAYVLWTRFLKHNPSNPQWFDRDRFVLSAGHGSMLLYGLLHLTGYELSLDDIQQFRQWGSRTPGHPERGHTPGVEITTGPLGQGIGECGRHGDCRSAARGALQPARIRCHRSLDLRDCQRRRPDGRCRVRSCLARRPPETRQAHLPVRRQSHHAGSRHRYRIFRGSRTAIRSLRLAHGVRAPTATISRPSTRRCRAHAPRPRALR